MAKYKFNKKTKKYEKTKTRSTSFYKKKSSSSSKKSSSKSSSSTPRVITDNTSITTIKTSSGTKTWKGDPKDAAGIANWKKSYEPGYKSTIISPRNSKGNYTSDPKKTVGYITMDKVTHAKEIAIALQNEPKIPMSIIDSLQKTLGKIKEEIIETHPPTATILTKTKEGEETGRNLTSMTKGKFGAIVGAGLILVIFLLKLGQTRK